MVMEVHVGRGATATFRLGWKRCKATFRQVGRGGACCGHGSPRWKRCKATFRLGWKRCKATFRLCTRLLEEVQRNFPVGLRSDRDFHGCRKRCRVVCCRGSPWLLDEVRSNFPADWAAQYKAKGIGAKPLSRQGLRRCEEASDPGWFWYMLCVTYFLKKNSW